MFGENRFAVRLPSALSAGGTAALIFLLVALAARRRDPAAPALAALIFLSSLGAAACGVTAVLDNPLTTFLTGTLAAFFAATTAARRSRRETGWLVLCGVFAGLAFLTKGFLAFVVPALAAGAYLVWQRRFVDLARMAWLPVVSATALALPWAVAIHLREPTFWPFFVWNEHIHRFLAEDAQHPQPWWYFLVTFPALLLPWTFAAPAAARGLRDGGHPEARDLLRFCLCWLVVPLAFFSASSGKILTYVVPLLPPAAILVALGLARAQSPSGSRSLRRGLVVGGVTFALAAIVLPLSGSAGPVPKWPSAAALALVATALGWAARRGARPAHLLAVGLASGLVVVAVSCTLPSRTLASRCPGALLTAQAAEVGGMPILLSDSNTVRAVSWDYRRADVILVATSQGEFTFGIEQDPHSQRVLDLDAAARLIEENRGRVALVTTAVKYSRWKERFPAPLAEFSSGPRGHVIARY